MSFKHHVIKVACSVALVAIAAFHSAAQNPTRYSAYTTVDDGTQIVYDVQGDGPVAVILVHGWSCDRTYWSGQAPLAKKYKVVTIDLAGHGGSGQERKVYSMSSFGADVAAVINKLELKNIILVGHSMGGDVIAEAARQLMIVPEPAFGEAAIVPPKIHGLIMVDTYKKLGAGRSPQEVESIVASVRTHFRDSTQALVRRMFLPTSDPKLVEYVAADMSSAHPTVALSAMHYALSYSREMPAALEELRLPTIFINPDNAPTDMASMKKYGVEVVIIKGTGHFPMMEDVKGFNALFVAAVMRLAAK